MKRLIAAGATALMCGYGVTAPTTAGWAGEPSKVFGIALGAPLDEAVLPPCPPRDFSKSVPPLPTSLCREMHAGGEGGWLLLGTPDLGFEYGAVIAFRRELVQQLQLNFKSFAFDAAINVLVERYGPPTEQALSEVTSRAGAKVNSRTLKWVGRNVILVAVEHNGRLDISQVVFFDVKLLVEQQKAAADATKQAAGRL